MDVISLNTPLDRGDSPPYLGSYYCQNEAQATSNQRCRGAVVDPQAVYEALEAGQLLGFATDVFESEPPVAGDPLLKLAAHPRVLLTPHVAWASEYALDKLWKKVKNQIEEFIK